MSSLVKFAKFRPLPQLHHTEAFKRRQRKPKSEETKRRMSEAHKGKKLPESTKAAMSKSAKVRMAKLGSPTAGKSRSEETKEKIRQSMLKRSKPNEIQTENNIG